MFVLVLQVLFRLRRWIDCVGCEHRECRDGIVGSIPEPGVTCGLSLLLVLVPAPRVFLRVLRFSFLHKNQLSKFQFDPEMRATGLATLLSVSTSLNKVNFFYFILLANWPLLTIEYYCCGVT